METKKCSTCGRTLPVSEFNWANRGRGELQVSCRACCSEYNRRRYAGNRDKFKSAVRNYKASNPCAVLKTRLGTNKKAPSKQNARKCVEAAIVAGVLTRPSVCSGCGCSDTEHRIEAHHHDYRNPLNVIWVCTPCHRRLDQMRKAREERDGEALVEERADARAVVSTTREELL